MRVMVIVKASKESEAGVLPDTEGLTKMLKYNEELVKSGVILAGDGLQPDLEGQAGEVFGKQVRGHRWAVHGNQGIDRRVRDLAGSFDRRGSGVGETGAVRWRN